jgi:hypothetical protein
MKISASTGKKALIQKKLFLQVGTNKNTSHIYISKKKEKYIIKKQINREKQRLINATKTEKNLHLKDSLVFRVGYLETGGGSGRRHVVIRVGVYHQILLVVFGLALMAQGLVMMAATGEQWLVIY